MNEKLLAFTAPNYEARSGGMGSGNLPMPEYKAPTGWQPQKITSNLDGVHIEPLPDSTPTGDPAEETKESPNKTASTV